MPGTPRVRLSLPGWNSALRSRQIVRSRPRVRSFFWRYMPVFLELCPILRPTRILADFAVLGFGDAGPWGSLARQPEAAALHADPRYHGLSRQPGDPFTARRSKTGVCEALGEG